MLEDLILNKGEQMYTHPNPIIGNKNNLNPAAFKNLDIDEIIRGEISAVEAYEQVMEKVKDDPEAYRLRQFKLDHQNAVQYWKKEEKISGKIPQMDSSVWGAAVEAFIGVSKLIGEETALRALKKGEEHGLTNYEKMLTSSRLTSYQKEEIRKTYIPRQKRHIESLNALIKLQ